LFTGPCASLLHPCCNPIPTPLLSICIPITSLLHLRCIPTSSLLHPLCTSIPSPMHPCFISSVSLLHLHSIPPAFQLHPCCIPPASQQYPPSIPAASLLHRSCITTASPTPSSLHPCCILLCVHPASPQPQQGSAALGLLLHPMDRGGSTQPGFIAAAALSDPRRTQRNAEVCPIPELTLLNSSPHSDTCGLGAQLNPNPTPLLPKAPPGLQAWGWHWAW